jgi:NadR type nicotinamide-nucleotide adenylyltransferase
MQEIKKVVIIGPESTGKSTICTLLAQHFSTSWCPEYARDYLLEHGTGYTFETLGVIAKGQLALEDKVASEVKGEKSDRSPLTSHVSLPFSHPSPLLFIDTDMYVMKVWCEYVFSKCHPFILDEIVSRKYDLYLLCNTDIAWVQDELREYPDENIRLELFHIYKDILANQSVPWVELKGNYDTRLQTAIDAVHQYIK